MIVTEAAPYAERPEADALVTDRPGLLLGVVTADCAPVLLADAKRASSQRPMPAGAGRLAGVTDQAIAAMISLGAKGENIAAAIGPCLAKASYEVDQGFRGAADRRRSGQ